MPEQSPTLPYPPVVEAPKEPKNRSERYWRRLVPLAAVVGAVALAGASGSSEKPSLQGETLKGVGAPAAMTVGYEPSVGTFEQSGLVSSEVQLIYQASKARMATIGLERSYVDRPDEVVNPQVHGILVKPVDGDNRNWDTDGTLGEAIWHSNDWLAGTGREDGLSLRIDTYKGQPDISYFDSPWTSNAFLALGYYGIYQLGPKLEAAGFKRDSDKKWLVMYDGPMVACGQSSIPGDFPTISLEPKCGGLPTTPSIFTYRDHTIQHEFGHSLGIPHIPDSRDLMYGQASSDPEIQLLDPDGNKYKDKFVPYLTTNHEPVNIDIAGEGAVQSDIKPNKYLGIGGSYTSEDGKMWFRSNDVVTLGATPEDQTWKFNGWSGAGTGNNKRVITITGEQAVMATFEPIVNLDLTVRGAGVVKVSGEKACKSAGVKVVLCHYEEKPGTKTQLTAVATANSRFVKWLSSNSTKPTLKYTNRHGQDKEITGIFSETSVKRTTKSKNKK